MVIPHDGLGCAICDAGGALVYRRGVLLCIPCRDNLDTPSPLDQRWPAVLHRVCRRYRP